MIKARRSVLYLPADKRRVLEKAQELTVDCLIFDLEDAVSPANKIQARQQLQQALKEFSYGKKEKVIRINHLSSEWGNDDLQMVLNSDVDAVLLPKVETKQEVEYVAQCIKEKNSTIKIWAMVETVWGVENVNLFSSCDLLEVLVMGTNDLSKELRVPQKLDRLAFLYSLSRCVLAARLYKLDIIDGVYIHFKDQQGLEFSCQQGKDLGFDGKTLIHPAQLETTNNIFAPSANEVIEAKELVAAWKNAEENDLGVLVVNGRLVEELHVEQAKRVLQLAAAIEEMHINAN